MSRQLQLHCSNCKFGLIAAPLPRELEVDTDSAIDNLTDATAGTLLDQNMADHGGHAAPTDMVFNVCAIYSIKYFVRKSTS